jgi:AraC family transcriptional regulator of adaptative response / DNA-3-methyladenine glycosylase II
MLAFLAARAIPGVEAVAGGIYRRSFSFGLHHGWLEVAPDEESRSVRLRVHFPDPRWLRLVVERVRALFDLNADWSVIAPVLGADPMLRETVKAAPGLRVPGCWDGFELSTRAILGQQITVKGASALAGRLVREFGKPAATAPGLTHVFPSPAVLAEANLTRAGLTRKRAETVQLLARAVAEGEIDFAAIGESEAFLNRLRRIPGIGPWTAQYVAMRALRMPDAFPSGDLGLLRVLGIKNARELERRAETWRPWRAYATMYLWNMGHAKGARGQPEST